MALLQYKCTGCNLEFEQLVKDSLQDVFCPKCKEKAKRVMEELLECYVKDYKSVQFLKDEDAEV